MIRPLVLAALFLPVAACGPLITAGNPCTTRADCNPSYTCFQKQPSGQVDIPGGYCSRGCVAEGQTYDCPGGTVCSFFGDSQLICSIECTTNTECRDGYVCADVALGNPDIGNRGGAKKSCIPQGARR
jgi:hypothetical protein